MQLFNIIILFVYTIRSNQTLIFQFMRILRVYATYVYIYSYIYTYTQNQLHENKNL